MPTRTNQLLEAHGDPMLVTSGKYLRRSSTCGYALRARLNVGSEPRGGTWVPDPTRVNSECSIDLRRSLRLHFSESRPTIPQKTKITGPAPTMMDLIAFSTLRNRSGESRNI